MRGEKREAMARAKLKAARIAKGIREQRRLTQEIAARELGCSVDTYSMWECGTSTPHEHSVKKLCDYYKVQDPLDLDLVPRAALLSLSEIVQMLAPYNTREVLAALQQLPAFADIDLVALLDVGRRCTGSTFIYVQHIHMPNSTQNSVNSVP